jgi:hypothetical protein
MRERETGEKTTRAFGDATAKTLASLSSVAPKPPWPGMAWPCSSSPTRPTVALWRATTTHWPTFETSTAPGAGCCRARPWENVVNAEALLRYLASREP